jgi:hypothetical protein
MPLHPHCGPLVPLADNLWASEYELRMGPGFYMPVRMTVLRLGDGSLVLWSPGPIQEPLAAEIADLGEVSALVAPNCLHHLYVAAAKERYPQATILAAPGLQEKRPDLPIDGGLATPPPSWGGEVRLLTIAGARRLGEVVALHRPSATLLVTDLIFNMGDVRGLLTPWILRTAGVYRRFGQSRLIRLLVDDRAAAGDSVRELLSWPFERVVSAHGAVVDGDDVRERSAAALRWMLADAASPPR